MSLKIELQTLNIGIKDSIHDAVCFKLPKNSITAMVTTKNRYAAAPVILSKINLKKNQPKYLFINSGNANACTGKVGAQNAQKCTKALSKKLKCKESEILLFSTGIIGKQLPIDIINNKIAKHKFQFKSSWSAASKAIMTTDAYNKFYSKSFLLNNKKVTIKAISKGAGMIEPNMATMLAFISIDLKLNKQILSKLLKQITDSSFNSISVDGDMSTNDSVALISWGEMNSIKFLQNSKNYKKLLYELTLCCQTLARMIIQDGEGATKSILINVNKSKNKKEAKLVAYSLANSNLIKTAMYGADPNWGRIIARLGSIDNVKYTPEKVKLKINDMMVFNKGVQSNNFNLKSLNKSMKKKEITIDIDLNSGDASHTVITSDLTEKYVHINSAYTT
tara:strand:+ start:1975 stop:3150 length:1176 start_codon:yes stop_codon:yes gene_type:complete